MSSRTIAVNSWNMYCQLYWRSFTWDGCVFPSASRTRPVLMLISSSYRRMYTWTQYVHWRNIVVLTPFCLTKPDLPPSPPPSLSVCLSPSIPPSLPPPLPPFLPPPPVRPPGIDISAVCATNPYGGEQQGARAAIVATATAAVAAAVAAAAPGTLGPPTQDNVQPGYDGVETRTRQTPWANTIDEEILRLEGRLWKVCASLDTPWRTEQHLPHKRGKIRHLSCEIDQKGFWYQNHSWCGLNYKLVWTGWCYSPGCRRRG